MRCVVKKSSHSNVESAFENEIMDGLISAMFRWNSAICWTLDEAWVALEHDTSQCNAATIVTTFESVTQFGRKHTLDDL